MMQIIYEDTRAAWPGIGMTHRHVPHQSTRGMHGPVTSVGFSCLFLSIKLLLKSRGGRGWSSSWEGEVRKNRYPSSAVFKDRSIIFPKPTVSSWNLLQEVPLIKSHLFRTLPFYGHKFTVAIYCSSLRRHPTLIFPVTFISIAIKYEYEKARK